MNGTNLSDGKSFERPFWWWLYGDAARFAINVRQLNAQTEVITVSKIVSQQEILIETFGRIRRQFPSRSRMRTTSRASNRQHTDDIIYGTASSARSPFPCFVKGNIRASLGGAVSRRVQFAFTFQFPILKIYPRDFASISFRDCDESPASPRFFHQRRRFIKKVFQFEAICRGDLSRITSKSAQSVMEEFTIRYQTIEIRLSCTEMKGL